MREKKKREGRKYRTGETGVIKRLKKSNRFNQQLDMGYEEENILEIIKESREDNVSIKGGSKH